MAHDENFATTDKKWRLFDEGVMRALGIEDIQASGEAMFVMYEVRYVGGGICTFSGVNDGHQNFVRSIQEEARLRLRAGKAHKLLGK